MQYIDCFIDPIARTVSYPAGTTIVQRDTNVEVLKFHYSLEAEHTLENDSIRIMVLKDGETHAFSAENVRIEANDGGDDELVFEHTITTLETVTPGQISVSVCGNQISGGIVTEAWHTLNMTFQVTGAAHTDSDEGEDTPETMASNAEKIAALQVMVDAISSGNPVPVESASMMEDESVIYLYTGNEEGYYTNHWYYYDQSQEKFIPGAIYGSADVDATLSIPGAAADAKAVGDYIMTDAEAVNLLAEASDDEERDFIGDGILSWLDDHPEAVTVQDGSLTEDKFSEDLKESLFDKSAYYDEITVTKERLNNTDCYFATVPVEDNDGNLIDFYVDYDTEHTNPLSHAIADHTTLTVNGDCSLDVGEPTFLNPIRIGKGVVLRDRSFSGYANSNPRYIGIKADRSHVEYAVNGSITAQQMLNNGCVNVFSSYAKIVENSTAMDLSGVYWNEFTYSADARNPCMLLGFDTSNNIKVMACDGRTGINAGLTLDECASIMISKGCKDVYVLDGGGSACLCDRGSKVNRNIDDGGTTVRGGRFTLNVKKDFDNTSEQQPTSKVGLEKQRIIEQILPYVNHVNARISGCIFDTETVNIDEFVEKGLLGTFFLNSSDSNVLGTRPETVGVGLLFTLKQSDNLARQVYIPITQKFEPKFRIYTYATKTWGDWTVSTIGATLDRLGRSTFSDYVIEPGASMSFTIGNTSRANITVNGTQTEQQGFILLASNSSGTVRHTDISLGSSIALTTGTNQLTIANNGATQAMVTIMTTYGQITKVEV